MKDEDWTWDGQERRWKLRNGLYDFRSWIECYADNWIKGILPPSLKELIKELSITRWSGDLILKIQERFSGSEDFAKVQQLALETIYHPSTTIQLERAKDFDVIYNINDYKVYDNGQELYSLLFSLKEIPYLSENAMIVEGRKVFIDLSHILSSVCWLGHERGFSSWLTIDYKGQAIFDHTWLPDDVFQKLSLGLPHQDFEKLSHDQEFLDLLKKWEDLSRKTPNLWQLYTPSDQTVLQLLAVLSNETNRLKLLLQDDRYFIWIFLAWD